MGVRFTICCGEFHMVPTIVISSVFAALMGVIGFSVLKSFITGQDTSTWSAAERAIISDAVPVGIGMLTFIILMAGITKMRNS